MVSLDKTSACHLHHHASCRASFCFVGLLGGGCNSLSVLVVLATFLSVVGCVGPAVVLTMLTELHGVSFLRDLLTLVRRRPFLGAGLRPSQGCTILSPVLSQLCAFLVQQVLDVLQVRKQLPWGLGECQMGPIVLIHP
jgi:hypothetical protein